MGGVSALAKKNQKGGGSSQPKVSHRLDDNSKREGFALTGFGLENKLVFGIQYMMLKVLAHVLLHIYHYIGVFLFLLRLTPKIFSTWPGSGYCYHGHAFF
jgi:hypothetical protein